MTRINELDSTVTRCFTRLAHEAATPFAYKMLRHLKNGDWRALCASAPRPGDYTHAPTYQADALVGCFFKKYADWDLGEDLVAKAMKSFSDTEEQCFRTNVRLAPFVVRDESPEHNGPLGFINLVRKNVSRILGRIPNSVMGRFGPGSTYGDIGALATLPDKMNSYPTMTLGADCLLPLWDETAWARYGCNRLNLFTEYARRSPEVVRGNRFTTVPKDALKRRGICIEPSINLYYQLGLGGVIRDKLTRVGIDIPTSQARHQRLAQKASIDGSLATLDLSNASDTICYNLVKLLLPTEWFLLLDSLRSPLTFISGKWVRLNKFSSMGNGFTFELETLLFYCIALAVHEHNGFTGSSANYNVSNELISVYGDDIIVPTSIADDVIIALSFFGLTTNKEKSFTTGPFRESCGGDYFEGVDVRPHFLKESPNEPQQLIALANGLRRCGKVAANPSGGNLPYHRAWLSCIDALPSAIRACKGPERLGDIVIHQEYERWSTNRRERGGISYIKCYRPVRPRRFDWNNWHPGVVLASALYGSGDGSDTVVDSSRKTWDYGGVYPRQTTMLSHKVGWVAQS